MTNNRIILSQLDQNQRRLAFYSNQKEALGPKSSKAAKSLEKWIEIYAERVKVLERQIQKAQKSVGLTTQIDKTKRVADYRRSV